MASGAETSQVGSRTWSLGNEGAKTTKDLLCSWWFEALSQWKIHDLGIKGIALGFFGGFRISNCKSKGKQKPRLTFLAWLGSEFLHVVFCRRNVCLREYVFSTTGFCVGKCANVNHVSHLSFVSDSILLPERAWGKTWKFTGTEKLVGVRPVVCTIFTWTSPWRMVESLATFDY